MNNFNKRIKYTLSMKALIPAAGIGTRLRPHTFTKPKPMIYVAGKQIIGHILDNLIGCVDEVVIVVGYMKETLIEYVEENYKDNFKITFVDQKERLGLGHAVYVAKNIIKDSQCLITLGDEFFGVPFKEMIETHEKQLPCDASIGVKVVDLPQHYGIVEFDNGHINRLVEKPKEPKSNMAIAGVYIIENTKLLYKCLKELIKENKSGEYQLTDALQKMVDKGATLKKFNITNWYDCGRPEMLLNVNKMLLNQNTKIIGMTENCVINEPVIVDENSYLRNSIIGPNVSVAKGTVIENAIVENSIIGFKSRIKNIILKDSLIGDEVVVQGSEHKMNVGENTKIVME